MWEAASDQGNVVGSGDFQKATRSFKWTKNQPKQTEFRNDLCMTQEMTYIVEVTDFKLLKRSLTDNYRTRNRFTIFDITGLSVHEADHK